MKKRHFLDSLECPYNVDVLLHDRYFSAVSKHLPCDLYISDYYWVFVIDDAYEFYFNPDHFIGKIDAEVLPQIVKERIEKECVHFPRPEGFTPGDGRRVQIPFEKIFFTRGNWFYAQGYNYITMNGKLYTDNGEPYPGVICEFDLKDADLWDLTYSKPSTVTHLTIHDLFELPCFYGVDTTSILVKPLFEKWNSKRWSVCFGQAKGKSEHLILRKDVFRHTVACVRMGYYYSEEGEKQLFPDPSFMITHTFFATCVIKAEKKDRTVTSIAVWKKDSLTAAKQLIDEGYHPAVLNMANRHTPGGGAHRGAGAQEANIFRRSNLFQSLYQFSSHAEAYGLTKAAEQYPMDRNFGGIYTPRVTVFRGEEKDGYPMLAEPYSVDIISVAGINGPRLNQDGKMAKEDLVVLENKIRTILRLGVRGGNDALLLGALGCGAFYNPPEQVAAAFNRIFKEPEFEGCFKKIVFAIQERHSINRQGKPANTYKLFLKEFDGIADI